MGGVAEAGEARMPAIRSDVPQPYAAATVRSRRTRSRLWVGLTCPSPHGDDLVGLALRVRQHHARS